MGEIVVVRLPILEVQTDCILDVAHRLIIISSLAVAPLEGGARHKEAIRIAFDDYR
jgi:hypothetical protein